MHSHIAKGSGYYPYANAMEGGFNDRMGKKLATLQDFLQGKTTYVSVAMDKKLHIPYGAKLTIPELEKRYGRTIEFRVVDTGDAFTDKGFTRIDICTPTNRRRWTSPSMAL
jgi:3D (Asp-Asp-Asp) domain-containing protein